jgi:hypothetical protein
LPAGAALPDAESFFAVSDLLSPWPPSTLAGVGVVTVASLLSLAAGAIELEDEDLESVL